MNTTIRRTATATVFTAAIVAGGIGSALAMAATAHAGTVPGTYSTAMTITNNTGQALHLTQSGVWNGRWEKAPRQALAPGASEVVVAYTNAPGGESSTITYTMPDGTDARLNQVNVPGTYGANGTGVTGPSSPWTHANFWYDNGGPNANMGYTIGTH